MSVVNLCMEYIYLLEDTNYFNCFMINIPLNTDLKFSIIYRFWEKENYIPSFLSRQMGKSPDSPPKNSNKRKIKKWVGMYEKKNSKR